MMNLYKFFSLKKIIIVLLTSSSFSCASSPRIDSRSDTFRQDIFAYFYENREVLNLCQGQIDLELAQKNITLYPIDKKTYLIEFLCFLGAYQGNYQYFIYQEKPQTTVIKPVSFEIFQESETQEIIKTTINYFGGLPSYDLKTRTLEMVTKYRGLADCGSWGKYQWDQTEFKLIEYRLKANCDGQYVQPENYAKVYP